MQVLYKTIHCFFVVIRRIYAIAKQFGSDPIVPLIRGVVVVPKQQF